MLNINEYETDTSGSVIDEQVEAKLKILKKSQLFNKILNVTKTPDE